MDTLKNLRISDKKLGSGSYGSVFQATMLYNGILRDVAVKKIHNDREHYSQNARREHEALSRLCLHGREHEALSRLCPHGREHEALSRLCPHGREHEALSRLCPHGREHEALSRLCPHGREHEALSRLCPHGREHEALSRLCPHGREHEALSRLCPHGREHEALSRLCLHGREHEALSRLCPHGREHEALSRLCPHGREHEALSRLCPHGREHEALSRLCPHGREHEALSRLCPHENIVELLNVTNDRHYIYVIMEYAELGDLDKYVENNILELRDKIKIMSECAAGVQFMHSLNPQVIHRDIKPGNILLQSSAQGPVAKICDFGLARIFQPKADAVYMSTDAGTPMYRAPEQFTKGRLRYTAAVDVFSLGLVCMGLLNVNMINRQIESNPESLNGSDILPYAQHLKQTWRHRLPMPALFTLTSDEKWPKTEIKALITNMAAFKAEDRIKIGDVKATLIAVMSAYDSNTGSAVAQCQHQISKLKSQLSDVSVILQDDEVIILRNEMTIVRKDQRIKELESQLAAISLQQTEPAASKPSPKAGYTNLQRENEREIETHKSQEIQIQESSQSASVVSANPTSSQHTGSFRKTNIHLANIKSVSPVTEHHFNIHTFCYRFCYYNNMFFFPHPDDNCIGCYTTTGQFVKSINLDQYKIKCPRSIHPLTVETVLIAARSGLYVVGTGEVQGLCNCILKGDCVDLHVCEGVVAVLVDQHGLLGNNGRVYLYNCSDLTTVKSTIKLKHNINFQYIHTLLISNDIIYISSSAYGSITAYCIATGQMISQYGRPGREAPDELCDPYLSVCDTEGSLLLVDWLNHRLQTLTARSEWAVLPGMGEVEYPQDVIIIDNLLYILNGFHGDNIKVFKITYK